MRTFIYYAIWNESKGFYHNACWVRWRDYPKLWKRISDAKVALKHREAAGGQIIIVNLSIPEATG